MIPKKIHYCWFGRNPLPESALKCIASWRKYLPDYEIIEWNEDNFDVFQTQYTAQAYQAGKYAFVSDYARFKILYEHGGLYFDTDVEVIRPMDDIIANGAFMGFEINPCKSHTYGEVNPGVGIGSQIDNPILGELIKKYEFLQFQNNDGSFNLTTIVKYTTDVLKGEGLSNVEGIQYLKDITIYPADYFNPYDDLTGRLKKTPNTVSIHWYSKSWIKINPVRKFISNWIHRIIGSENSVYLRKLIKR
ncbi:MAG: glycosyl transferase [Muribaculaceae bacterium]|nr:glycosyl transferase [Muribaculaceae bacterium]